MGSPFTKSNTVTSRFIDAYNFLRKSNAVEGAGDFSKRTGITIGKIKKVMDGEWEVGDMEASAVGEAFPQLRMDWILDGEGQMLHPDAKPKFDADTKHKNNSGAKGTEVTAAKNSRSSKPEAFRDSVSERYYRFIEHLIDKKKVKNVAQFGKKIGTSGAVFTAMKAGSMSITTERTERTAREFPELNMNWLFTGTGDMINNVGNSIPTTVSAETKNLPSLPGAMLEKLKECRRLLNGSWESASKETGLLVEDFDLLEAGKKPFIPNELLQYLYRAGIDINSLFDDSTAGVVLRQQQETSYEEILKRLNVAENSVIDMQQVGRENLAELLQLRKLLERTSTQH